MVTCSCCKGSGKEPLSEVLQRTLEAVPRKKFISTFDVEARVGDAFVKTTAINNRLAQHLLPLGLVESQRRGKTLFWKRIK